MRYVKKFETFDFSKTIPATSKEDLTSFYSCEECNALWKSFNESCDECRFCESSEIEELDTEEYYELVKLRLDDEEAEDLESERREDSENLVDLYKLKNNRKNVN
jgi:hypothetical protein